MRTYPVFVSAGDDHVAAVLTVPDEDACGVVVVLAGTGRHNVIGGTLAGRLAERLAAHRLASIRLDYAGVGDSPGAATSWTPADADAAVAQARAAVVVARDALHVTRFAGVGTCYGSRVVLGLVDDPACVGAICLAPPVLEHSGLSRAGRQLGDGGLVAWVKSNPLLRRLVVSPARRLLSARRPAGLVVGALRHLDRARVVFLYGRNPQADHYSARARESVEAAVSALPPEQRARFELRMLEAGPLTTFDGLSRAEQDQILEIVVPEVRACFEESGST